MSRKYLPRDVHENSHAYLAKGGGRKGGCNSLQYETKITFPLIKSHCLLFAITYFVQCWSCQRKTSNYVIKAGVKMNLGEILGSLKRA